MYGNQLEVVHSFIFGAYIFNKTQLYSSNGGNCSPRKEEHDINVKPITDTGLQFT